MESTLRSVERILRHDPAPALRFDHLWQRLARSGADHRLTATALRALLERHPDRFRVLEVWGGPWRRLSGSGAPGELAHDCWVAWGGAGPGGPGGGLDLRMRESVRWVARRLDPGSRHEVLRWHRLVLAEEAARPALRRPA